MDVNWGAKMAARRAASWDIPMAAKMVGKMAERRVSLMVADSVWSWVVQSVALKVMMMVESLGSTLAAVSAISMAANWVVPRAEWMVWTRAAWMDACLVE